MKERVWENPWRLMLAINVAVALGVFAHKIRLTPYIPYIHLLVDYHFCFIKRALIGALVALFTDKVPVWLPYALGGTVWLLTLALFMQLFRRTFGFDQRQLPLLVFTAGSPFFFKNFMHTLGHFDIYGCLFAICLLLLPARSFCFLIGVSLGYLVVFAIVFDYSRWVSNWHQVFRACRDVDPACRDCATVLESRPPDPHVKRALAAMADMRLLEADHQRAEFGQAEPLRDLAAQYAAFGFAHLALACDDEHEGEAVMMRALQEAEQRPMGAALRHAMQVEPRFDLAFAARQPRALAAPERCQRWRGRLARLRRLSRWHRPRRDGRFCDKVRHRRGGRLCDAGLLAQRLDLFHHAVPKRAFLLAQAALAYGPKLGD
jgi:hypothetical protein